MSPAALDLSKMTPCECAGCICVLQTTPHMMRSNTYCKMPRASHQGAGAPDRASAAVAAGAFLILCQERRGDLALWWRPNSAGYTVNLSEAGLYCEEEARNITRLRGTDYPIPAANLLTTRQVVSVEDGNNFELLQRYRGASVDSAA
jgi:hypothetical protein